MTFRKLIYPALALLLAVTAGLFWSQRSTNTALAQNSTPAGDEVLRNPQEKHLKNIKQLTFGGENAEAYFSGDGSRLIFQSKRGTRECDQIYTMKADGSDLVRLTNNAFNDLYPVPSPNGKQIVFQTDRDGHREVYVMNTDGSGQKKLVH